ncbi:hypothetical protein LguiA_012976 [Lonicera macranthoides]
MLRTLSTGLLSVCLTSGGKVVEDVLTSSLLPELMFCPLEVDYKKVVGLVHVNLSVSLSSKKVLMFDRTTNLVEILLEFHLWNHVSALEIKAAFDWNIYLRVAYYASEAHPFHVSKCEDSVQHVHVRCATEFSVALMKGSLLPSSSDAKVNPEHPPCLIWRWHVEKRAVGDCSSSRCISFLSSCSALHLSTSWSVTDSEPGYSCLVYQDEERNKMLRFKTMVRSALESGGLDLSDILKLLETCITQNHHSSASHKSETVTADFVVQKLFSAPSFVHGDFLVEHPSLTLKAYLSLQYATVGTILTELQKNAKKTALQQFINLHRSETVSTDFVVQKLFSTPSFYATAGTILTKAGQQDSSIILWSPTPYPALYASISHTSTPEPSIFGLKAKTQSNEFSSNFAEKGQETYSSSSSFIGFKLHPLCMAILWLSTYPSHLNPTSRARTYATVGTILIEAGQQDSSVTSWSPTPYPALYASTSHISTPEPSILGFTDSVVQNLFSALSFVHGDFQVEHPSVTLKAYLSCQNMPYAAAGTILNEVGQHDSCIIRCFVSAPATSFVHDDFLVKHPSLILGPYLSCQNMKYDTTATILTEAWHQDCSFIRWSSKPYPSLYASAGHISTLEPFIFGLILGKISVSEEPRVNNGDIQIVTVQLPTDLKLFMQILLLKSCFKLHLLCMYDTTATILTEAWHQDCSFIRWSSKPYPSLYASAGHISTLEPFIFGLTSGKISVSEEPRVNNGDIQLQQPFTGIKDLNRSLVHYPQNRDSSASHRSEAVYTVKYATAATILTEAWQQDCSFIRWSSKPYPSLYASAGVISTAEPFIFGLSSGKNLVSEEPRVNDGDIQLQELYTVKYDTTATILTEAWHQDCSFILSEEPRVNNGDIQLQQLYTDSKGLNCSFVRFSTYLLNFLQILQKKPGKLPYSNSSPFTDIHRIVTVKLPTDLKLFMQILLLKSCFKLHLLTSSAIFKEKLQNLNYFPVKYATAATILTEAWLQDCSFIHWSSKPYPALYASAGLILTPERIHRIVTVQLPTDLKLFMQILLLKSCFKLHLFCMAIFWLSTHPSLLNHTSHARTILSPLQIKYATARTILTEAWQQDCSSIRWSSKQYPALYASACHISTPKPFIFGLNSGKTSVSKEPRVNNGDIQLQQLYTGFKGLNCSLVQFSTYPQNRDSSTSHRSEAVYIDSIQNLNCFAVKYATAATILTEAWQQDYSFIRWSSKPYPSLYASAGLISTPKPFIFVLSSGKNLVSEEPRVNNGDIQLQQLYIVKYATAATILTEAWQPDCSFIRWSSKPYPALYASAGLISTPEPFIFGLTSGKNIVSEEPRVNNGDIQLQ